MLNGAYSDAAAVDRLTVTVVVPKFILNRVSGGVEIENKSGAEINLEDWSLNSTSKKFTFPQDTLISSGKKIVVADSVSGVGSGSVRLQNPLGTEYGSTVESATIIPTQEKPISLDEIQLSLDQVRQKLAALNLPPPSNSLAVANTGPSEPVSNVSPKPATPEVASGEKIKTAPVVDKPAQVPAVETQTATVFEAEKKSGFVSTVFSWPIKGIDFLRHLFVEE